MPSKLRFAPLLMTLLFALSGCADFSGPSSDDRSAAAQQAEQQEQAGNYQRAADLYWLASQRASGDLADRYKIKSAEMAYSANNLNQVRAVVSQIDESTLGRETFARKRLVEARLARQRNREQEAQNLLLFSTNGVSAEVQNAIARFKRGESLQATDISAAERSRLHGLMLEHQRSRDENDAGRIWYELSKIEPGALRNWISATNDPLIQGWLDLAFLFQINPEAEKWSRAQAVWQERYRGHPAYPGDPSAFVVRGGIIEADTIAILLPRSGSLARPAQAILNGITAAHNGPRGEKKPELRVYDSGVNPNQIVELYNTAIAQGADLVIGPFGKPAVDVMIRQRLNVPVLALNHASDAELYNPNLFQFGLIPEAEATAIAENMYLDGYTNVIAFAPDTQWGQRVVTTFNEKFTELGGTVLETGIFEGESNDYSDTIVRALQVERGEERHSGTRREDVEAIFVAANARQARLFKPLLEFHFAEDLTMYTTSAAFDGVPDARKNRDLNDINYLEMPWFLRQDPDPEDLVPEPEVLTGGDRYYPRLFAFGVDAYRLAPAMRQLLVSPDAAIPGYTGLLQATPDNRISNRYVRSTFTRGEPQPLPENTNTREMNYQLVQEKLEARAERLAEEAKLRLEKAGQP